MLETLGKNALQAKKEAASLSTDRKNSALKKVAQKLRDNKQRILDENQKDIEQARQNGLPEPLIDRLQLTESRIDAIADGMIEVSQLDDPVGEVISMKKRPNGLLVGQKRVPLGVVGVIYEARPNVTADVFALCFKSGNAMILKGGKDAARSNAILVKIIQEGLTEEGLNPEIVQLIEDNSRETTYQFMKMNDVLDVLIPRGGKGLIDSTVSNATVPVIETGTGNCHVYIDEGADPEMALDIVLNAKTQRVGVCNALESLLIHRNEVENVLPSIARALSEKQVELRLDRDLLPYWPDAKEADETDWGTEYLDYILSVKAVDSLDEAIEHINRYSTGHSESIITNSYSNAQRFLDDVDSAAVYVNASTRFTDGNEFGFGSEIGISTQKLHARGPMGLPALTTTKYIIYGQGQTR